MPAFNPSIRYMAGALMMDHVPLRAIAEMVGTPTYVYSLPRALTNFHRIREAFAPLKPHIHFSAKSNGNLAVLAALIRAGAGIDAVSGGEIFRALKAGAEPENIVFAGVGKTEAELRYAIEQNVGWINLENEAECALIERIAATSGTTVRAALRYNPDVSANTHRHIATGHGGAKFGLSADAIRRILDHAFDMPHIRFEGIHIHIGSQLHDVDATVEATRAALALIASYPAIRTVDIGGGIPAPYDADETLPTPDDFAVALAPLLEDYEVILEPGRAIVADAGVLLTQVSYLKTAGSEQLIIVDAGMTDLIRPMLYEAHHDIVPLNEGENTQAVTVVGPICESTDVIVRDVPLPKLERGDLLAILTTGAYGMVMASQYNARPRPAEVVVLPDGATWQVARRRETWDDLVAAEMISETIHAV